MRQRFVSPPSVQFTCALFSFFSLTRLPLEGFLKGLEKTATGGGDKLWEMESPFRTTLCVFKNHFFFTIIFPIIFTSYTLKLSFFFM